MAHGHYAKTLPNDLSAPAFVNAWRTRALIVGAVFAVLGIILALIANAQGDHWNHFFRAWLMGFMICFGFAVGGLALLMVQYCSGGKWGLLIRRPLEAMTRTMPLVVAFFLPVGLMAKKLYLWAQYPDAEEALEEPPDQRDAGSRDRLQEADAEYPRLLGGLDCLLLDLELLLPPAQSLVAAA